MKRLLSILKRGIFLALILLSSYLSHAEVGIRELETDFSLNSNGIIKVNETLLFNNLSETNGFLLRYIPFVRGTFLFFVDEYDVCMKSVNINGKRCAFRVFRCLNNLIVDCNIGPLLKKSGPCKVVITYELKDALRKREKYGSFKWPIIRNYNKMPVKKVYIKVSLHKDIPYAKYSFCICKKSGDDKNYGFVLDNESEAVFSMEDALSLYDEFAFSVDFPMIITEEKNSNQLFLDTIKNIWRILFIPLVMIFFIYDFYSTSR